MNDRCECCGDVTDEGLYEHENALVCWRCFYRTYLDGVDPLGFAVVRPTALKMIDAWHVGHKHGTSDGWRWGVGHGVIVGVGATIAFQAIWRLAF